MDWFEARITYSADWSDTGQGWTSIEGFQNDDFLNAYLKAMDWRIVKVERIDSIHP